jgi:hypothetical protein
MSWFLKLAVLLGGAPLFCGTLVYCAWRFTRWQWLETAGLITIAAGVVAFVAGVILLLIHLWRESRVIRVNRTSLWPQAILVGGLLASNFPVAAFYVLSAISVATRYSVSLYNDTNEPIHNVVVTGPGVHFEISAIAPRYRVQRHFHFHGDGSLTLVVHQNGKQISSTLEEHVTGGIGGSREVIIKEAGKIEVLPASR